ncbi:MAG: HEAT repeat domain-containing protein [Planctomycetota bacterium]
MRLLALLALLCLQDARDQLAAIDRDAPTLRRTLQHGELLERLNRLAQSTADQAVQVELAARIATLTGEAELLLKLGPLAELRSQPIAELVRALASQTSNAQQDVALARLCFFHHLQSQGEAALGRARDRSPELKHETDRLLAESRHEPIPAAGYDRYRGAWLDQQRAERARSLDALLEALAALPLDVRWPLRPTSDTSSLDEFTRLGADGPAFLRKAAARVRDSLQADYEEVRRWRSSYSVKSTLQPKLLAKRDEMAQPRREALELIARYEKPEQPAVDQYRSRLETLHQEYQSLVSSDRHVFDRIPEAQAHALLESIAAREAALARVHRFLEQYDAPGLEPAAINAPATAAVSRQHLLPGREQSSLEDVLWLLLKQRAGQWNDVITRSTELLAKRAALTPWEVMLAEELRDAAVLCFNASCATSLDHEERRFIDRLNEYRAALGLPMLQIDERCVVAARKHSEEMVELGYFGHISPLARNRTPTDRVRLEGFAGGVGENCLKGSADGVGAFEGWYHSPGHHRNLIGGGPQVGVGATADHAMWTHVVGGSDLAWRIVHRDLEPARRVELELAARALAGAMQRPRRKHDQERARARAEDVPEPEVVASQRLEQARAQATLLLPDVLAPIAEIGFSAANDARADDREAAPSLLAFVANAPVDNAWRPLRLAAVAALINCLEDWVPVEVRKRAFHELGPLVDRTFGYQPDSEKPLRIDSLKQLRQYWQDQASLTFGGRSAASDVVPAVPVGRVGDGPSLSAPRKVLTSKERLKLARQFGGSAETEQAVERGLGFLSRVQDEDGAWRARSFPSLGAQFRNRNDAGIGNAEWEVAMTGLSLLAFITAGNTTHQGNYASVVERGSSFLLGRMSDYGRFETTASHYMYNHAIATQALCELYAYTADPYVGIGAQLAVDYLMYAQHSESGGWRYSANEYGDTSVTGWVILALNAAHKAGLDVAGFHGALRFLDHVTEPTYHRVGYQSPADDGTRRDRLGSVAMVGRLFLGVKKTDARLLYPARRLKSHLPRRGEEDFYYYYYGTLAMFQMGAEFWDAWNAALMPVLLQTQESDPKSPWFGAWPLMGEFAGTGGRIFQTALGVLMLTTYYRYDRALEPRIYAFTGDLQKEVAPYLAALRAETDPIAHAVTRRKLVDKFGSALPPLLIALLQKQGEPDAVRSELAELLYECALPEHEGAIMSLLPAAGSDHVLEMMLRTLDQICSARSIPSIVSQLGHANATVRSYAAHALGKIADPAAVAPLSERLAVEADAGCKAAITTALGRIATRETIATVVNDALPQAAPGRLRVLEALEVFEQHGLAKMLLATRAADPALYQRCLAAIRADLEAAAVPLLLLLLESKELEVRTAANKLVRAVALVELPFTPTASPEERKKQLAQWQAFWAARADEFGAKPPQRPGR